MDRGVAEVLKAGGQLVMESGEVEEGGEVRGAGGEKEIAREMEISGDFKGSIEEEVEDNCSGR